MSCVLGIHLGHHSSCAVVRDGELVSALQTERHSGIKHHPLEWYTGALPVDAALRAAGVRMSDVDLIVSSLQAIAPGGFGLHQPLIDPSFKAFDLFSDKHWAISHHLAHAHCTFGTSGFEDAAILVCDYAGSSTVDGQDFALPFSDYHRVLTTPPEIRELKSECLSIYDAERRSGLRLLEREYAVPHAQPRSFVHSAASLYENVTGAVFRKLHAHGQLMALAAFAREPVDPRTMVSIDGDVVQFRNDWQHELGLELSYEAAANLAAGCQTALELAVLAYVRRTRTLTASRRLALCGGIFLNILANTRLANEADFEAVWVPSSPHDAGISVGCAFWGAHKLGECHARRQRSDRLGVSYGAVDDERALSERAHLVTSDAASPRSVAELLLAGKIVARCHGRAEFGPRALGGRSLLASPCHEQSKRRLNVIKGRQPWRPVAPIVVHERLTDFFDGPRDSFWMTFSHLIREQHRERLPALQHPDHSTRAQALLEEQDPWLYELLLEFERLSGFPIVVNTSLNGPGQPILETPSEALGWYLQARDVDYLLLNERRVARRPAAEALREASVRWHDAVVVSFRSAVPERALLVRGGRSIRVSEALARDALTLLAPRPVAELANQLGESTLEELYDLVLQGHLAPSYEVPLEDHARSDSRTLDAQPRRDLLAAPARSSDL